LSFGICYSFVSDRQCVLEGVSVPILGMSLGSPTSVVAVDGVALGGLGASAVGVIVDVELEREKGFDNGAKCVSLSSGKGQYMAAMSLCLERQYSHTLGKLPRIPRHDGGEDFKRSGRLKVGRGEMGEVVQDNGT
jgi:hypothetical protein